jgi:hypothetical protein
MNNQKSQSTILVKKPDGSFVRVSKDETVKTKPMATPQTVKKNVAPTAPRPDGDRTWTKDDHSSLLDPAFHDADVVATEAAQPRQKRPVSAVSAPVNTKTVPALDKIIRAAAVNESFGVRAIGGSKPLVRDITAPAPVSHVSMGPIDELRTCTLTDWRRLGTTSVLAGDQMWKKFSELQQESFVLFLDGVRAWHDSPLYHMYLDVLADAFSKGVAIDEYLGKGTPDTMKPEEWLAILALNNRLS